MIEHTVMWKFLPGKEEQARRFLDALAALDGQIPEIRSMKIGVRIGEKNDADAILTVTFDSLQALERYKNDPRHVAVSAMCREIRAARYAIDCEK